MPRKSRAVDPDALLGDLLRMLEVEIAALKKSQKKAKCEHCKRDPGLTPAEFSRLTKAIAEARQIVRDRMGVLSPQKLAKLSDAEIDAALKAAQGDE